MYRLWIVEDDMGIAEAIQTQAELWDMQVRCVRNFRNVMAEFADFDPHIVLLDISLPFFNGYHWCSEIRKVSKVPIIFISSASDNLNMVMAMNLGADDFIAKPFDQSVLMAKLQALLRRTYDFGAPQQVLEHRGALLGTALWMKIRFRSMSTGCASGWLRQGWRISSPPNLAWAI